MKALFVILFSTIFISAGFGQQQFHSSFEEHAFTTDDPLQIIISSQPDVDNTKFTEILGELDDLVDKLSSRRKNFSNDASFLEWAFYYVHRKKLGWYENYVSFSDIFLSKKYDCLTGSILYAYLLDQFDFQYSIYELDFHIFLVVHLPHQEILLEATDPLNGFVNDKDLIRERINKFIADGNSLINVENVRTQRSITESKSNIDESIALYKLAGLQYYNLSIKAYTENHYREAQAYITKAEQLYPSRRILDVKEIMLSAL